VMPDLPPSLLTSFTPAAGATRPARRERAGISHGPELATHRRAGPVWGSAWIAVATAVIASVEQRSGRPAGWWPPGRPRYAYFTWSSAPGRNDPALLGSDTPSYVPLGFAVRGGWGRFLARCCSPAAGCAR